MTQRAFSMSIGPYGVSLLEHAFSVDPHNPAVNNALAQHYLFKGDSTAVEQLTEALVRGGGGGAAGDAATGATPRLRAEAAYTRARLHHSRGELGNAQNMYMVRPDRLLILYTVDIRFANGDILSV